MHRDEVDFDRLPVPAGGLGEFPGGADRALRAIHREQDLEHGSSPFQVITRPAAPVSRDDAGPGRQRQGGPARRGSAALAYRAQRNTSTGIFEWARTFWVTLPRTSV